MEDSKSSLRHYKFNAEVEIEVIELEGLNIGSIKFVGNRSKPGYTRSLKEENIVINFDAHGVVTGIEFLDASKMPIRKE